MPHDVITPNILLQAYASGLFPMAEDRKDAALFWVDPEERGIIPFSSFHVPRSLAKRVRQEAYTITVDTAFLDVVTACAMPARGRETTWISGRIEALYTDLHSRGFAHSVECWLNDELVGGLYGVSLAGAFFGESMFSTRTDASKVALVHLVARLIVGGYHLLDTQFITNHLKQFGAQEIPRQEYQVLLKDALQAESAEFHQFKGELVSGSTILQLITQTS
ncbi:MAG: leucyl/phenylalanyl-tRNA--protein transferase [Kordiimonadaceae bacterium]|nr:leucyl/phenylalanyl-tRNA--protein transferase [Kordiimonadaceae bacterium]